VPKTPFLRLGTFSCAVPQISSFTHSALRCRWIVRLIREV